MTPYDQHPRPPRSGAAGIAALVMVGWIVLVVVLWRVALALVPASGTACGFADEGCTPTVRDALSLGGSTFGIPGLIVSLLLGLLVIRLLERRTAIRAVLHGTLAAAVGLGATALVVVALIALTAS
ncbi:MAG TPA: hypothetical protein VFJ12_04765 [Segeticoccus sp.]|nr:hypothetical protein [Segeticoccus sp.]